MSSSRLSVASHGRRSSSGSDLGRERDGRERGKAEVDKPDPDTSYAVRRGTTPTGQLGEHTGVDRCGVGNRLPWPAVA
jgi:hypothetical protein